MAVKGASPDNGDSTRSRIRAFDDGGGVQRQPFTVIWLDSS